METNKELDFANAFIKETNHNIFLTGKAGTGKTTFLQTLKKSSPKRMIVTAPTGVAAINAGGVTLHSFFQLSFSPYIPDAQTQVHEQYRFNRKKIDIIKSMDLLVIDEISMVRADLLDSVDAVLRRYKKHNLPFGGVQLLMIGDLQQLTPVTRNEEWELLKPYYDSCYFFSSLALQKTAMAVIELQKVYRQTDAEFIDLLNKVRDNQLDNSALQHLNSRHIPGFSSIDNPGYITLSTHNASADKINGSRLEQLKGATYTFNANVEGKFPDYTFPTNPKLSLKIGAQVMFVRNDRAVEKKFYNGKIGVITAIIGDKVHVHCKGDSEEIVVESITWENIDYTINKENQEIESTVVGKFIQHPLRLAWAITIHKSQGLTFEKAIIDAHAAFAHGQVYVALSRCKTFTGMVLTQPLAAHLIKTDKDVLTFVRDVINQPVTESALSTAKIDYQQKLLLECYDFSNEMAKLNRLLTLLLSNHQSIQMNATSDILLELKNNVVSEIHTVSDKFVYQLNRAYLKNTIPQEDSYIIERTKKAAHYFIDKLNLRFIDFVTELTYNTDNKVIRKQIKQAIENLQHDLSVKIAGLKICLNEFNSVDYVKAISSADLTFQPVTKDKKQNKEQNKKQLSTEIDHPDLFHELKAWRSKKADENEVAHYRILHQKVLIQLVNQLPQGEASLLKIKGIGKATAEKYGIELMSIISNYSKQHNLEENLKVPEKIKSTKTVITETKEISYTLFMQGKNIKDIAIQRQLTESTIEGHLALFVELGKINIEKLVSPQKKLIILNKIGEQKDLKYTDIKHSLGDDYSYGEICLVHSHLKYIQS